VERPLRRLTACHTAGRLLIRLLALRDCGAKAGGGAAGLRRARSGAGRQVASQVARDPRLLPAARGQCRGRLRCPWPVRWVPPLVQRGARALLPSLILASAVKSRRTDQIERAGVQLDAKQWVFHLLEDWAAFGSRWSWSPTAASTSGRKRFGRCTRTLARSRGSHCAATRSPIPTAITMSPILITLRKPGQRE